MQDINSILEKYWGYQSFRSLQPEIINAVLEGKDVLAVLPTGGGKSICFQVPAMANEGICLVVSPLIALMKDQVANLQNKGIHALAIYSGMGFPETKRTLENAAHGNYKFLYVSPERLETKLFLEFLPALRINLIAVDEAHCISQWGYDFRPPYLRIAALREHLPAVPVLALTASATKEVQDDICEKLIFRKDAQRFAKSFERPNLSYSVFNVPAKPVKLLEVIKNVKGSGIVYCKTRKHTKDVAELLKQHGIAADFYHAGLNNEERTNKQNDWINNKIRVIVSTNAFGMGIDKPDVRFVVHYDIPDCLENYYQEAGRAGRDEKRAYAVLLYSDRETADLKKQPDARFPPGEEIKKVYSSMMNYLQVPAHSGEGMSYDFDLSEFCSRFKLNVLTATFAIKSLEQEGHISFNELFFKPSSLVFSTSKESLVNFEKEHPELDDLVKGLLRSYEGIFDFPASINELQLSKFLHRDLPWVKKALLELQRFGIVDYDPQKSNPQVVLLQNRRHSDDFTIDNVSYNKRKQQYSDRIESMLDYTHQEGICRSRYIALYFNDSSVKPCGVCDHCIGQKAIHLSASEFDSLSSKILDTVNEKTVALRQILAGTGKIQKEKIWKVVNFLVAENKISITREGEIGRPGAT